MQVKNLIDILDPLMYVELKCQGGDGLELTKYRGMAYKIPEQYMSWDVRVLGADMNKIILNKEAQDV